MISEFLFNRIFDIVSGIFTMLPEFEWTIDLTTIEPFLDVFHTITYFFPMQIVGVIFLFYIWKQNYRLCIAILRTIWEILPVV